MDERQIILAIQNRDEAGLEELILHYSPLFHYIVAPIVKDPHDREDVSPKLPCGSGIKSINTIPIAEAGPVGLPPSPETWP